MVAIPGPSITPDRVLAAMHRPMPNIYQGPLVDVSNSIFADLPAIARTEGKPFMVIGNGHAAWQMAISNTLNTDKKVLVLESGRFAFFWGEMASMSGFDVEHVPGSDRGPVDPAVVHERLAQDTEHEIQAVLVVLTDTATGVRNDIKAIRAAIDAADHPALFMVDAIASLGCEPYEMDAWGVDLTVAASQKGLMTPPGIGLVWANDKALAAHDNANARVGYVDWEERMNVDEHYQYYGGTPPIPLLYALREALDMIAEEGGLEAVWARHEVLAGAVWAAVDAWSTPGGLENNIPDPAHRSLATTTVNAGSIDLEQLHLRTERDTGLTLGFGIGSDNPRFRIGHMGHLNPPMILGTLATTEATLLAMGAPLGGSGIAAATNHIAQALKH